MWHRIPLLVSGLCVDRSTVHDTQDMETTHVSVDEENVVRIIHNCTVKKQVLPSATRWMGLENTILSQLVMEDKIMSNLT